jgi:hypothetical protein
MESQNNKNSNKDNSVNKYYNNNNTFEDDSNLANDIFVTPWEVHGKLGEENYAN